MAIDPELENLVHFAEATRAFPGRTLCLQTLHRWRLRGVRGVRLETCLVGNLRFTSREAISRFLAAQNVDEQPAEITPSQRRRQSQAARKELERIGI